MGEDRKDEYEKICLMCRRPESRAGKMLEMGVHLPGVSAEDDRLDEVFRDLVQ